LDSPNGKHPATNERAEQPIPPLERPEEIVEFERATDPYLNMLPGISSIRAAETVGKGVQVGRRGNRLIMAVSLLMLGAILLPLILAVVERLVKGSP
jgi:hypothetical protein